MTPSSPILIPLLFIITRSTLGFQHEDYEVASIMKRMAENGEGFEASDVAKVHVVDGQEQTKRRLTKRDLGTYEDISGDVKIRALHLDLSSGSKVKLTLKRAGIVGPDTVFSIRSANESVVERQGAEDCYSHGQVEDSSGEGWATISHCNGLFGFASSPDYEYFLHPFGGARAKRDASEEFDVHVMWRPAGSESNSSDSTFGNVTDYLEPQKNRVVRRLGGSDDDRINATGFVVEMAMFSDERYWQRLNRMFPGRENEVLLTRLAGAQALYSNSEKVGYDVQIKVKLLEHWKTNPDEYEFAEKLSSNLRSFCKYTRFKYFYDVHALNTGVTQWNRGQVGLAYVRGACTKKRCMVTKSIYLKTFTLYAHELGHTLGMTHHTSAKCPAEIKSIGGFMGGGSTYNFSPCMRHQLTKFLQTSKSNCLFKESGQNKSPKEFSELPSLFPGQLKSPDELCEMLSGPDYKYAPVTKSLGASVCQWLMCLNVNDTSPDFRRARRMNAPPGFPCDEESMCVRDKSCRSWEMIKMSLKVSDLREMNRVPEWSEWSTSFSECSRTCGTGVRTRRRECLYSSFNLAPYCPGMAMQAQLCNTDPCPGDPSKEGSLRRHRGNQVCEGFKKNNVKLQLKKANGYLPLSAYVYNRDAGAKIALIQSSSCILKCQRTPGKVAGDLDAFMPDGTPCFDKTKSRTELERNNIKLKCLQGLCMEFSDCPNALESKDRCGVCGGNGSRCVDLHFDSAFDVPRGKRSYLTIIPAGATNIEARMNWTQNRGVILELWSVDGLKMIGKNGQYSMNVYLDSKAVNFVGTKWSYKRKHAYLRAKGPIEDAVVIRAFRQKFPITDIQVQYAQPAQVTIQT